MKKIYLFTIDDDYIKFLSSYDKKVCESKERRRNHTRKYIGAVLEVNGIRYFAPLSSPKPKDFGSDGSIRKDPVFLTRIITKNEQGHPELKGKVLIANMIPIVDCVATKYNIANEKDLRYKQLVIKEIDFITKNRFEIYKKAMLIYKQKCSEKTLKNPPKYLPHTIDFKLLESVCKKYKKKCNNG